MSELTVMDDLSAAKKKKAKKAKKSKKMGELTIVDDLSAAKKKKAKKAKKAPKKMSELAISDDLSAAKKRRPRRPKRRRRLTPSSSIASPPDRTTALLQRLSSGRTTRVRPLRFVGARVSPHSRARRCHLLRRSVDALGVEFAEPQQRRLGLPKPYRPN